jgi:hypothetical protein
MRPRSGLVECVAARKSEAEPFANGPSPFHAEL